MPPFPVFLQMDTRPATPPSFMVAGPSSLWRLAKRRSRKAGSGNIFSNVNLWQLQRLFRAAGDQDAEQRAQLVWGHRDEAELAQALIGLRARSHRRGLRTNGRDVLGSHWLQAFNHLRQKNCKPEVLKINHNDVLITWYAYCVQQNYLCCSGSGRACQAARGRTLWRRVILSMEHMAVQIHTDTTPRGKQEEVQGPHWY